MFKKVLAVAAVAIFSLGLTACGSSTPTDQVTEDLEAVKTENVEKTMEEAFATNEELDEAYQADYEAFAKKVQEFDYEIGEEKISEDENTATVEVTFTTYPFGEAYTEVYNQVLADAQSGKITADTDINAYVLEALFKGLSALEDKSYKATVTVNCTKDENGNWTSDIDSSDEVQDAVFGGMYTAINNVA